MRNWEAVMAVIPQAVPLGIPMGIAIGIAFSLSARPGRNIVKATLLGAVVASALSFGVLAWVMPAANQAFREMTIRELRADGYRVEIELKKGQNEMTLSELRREVASFSARGQTQLPRQFAFTLHLRFALAAATLILAGVVLAVPFNHRGLRGLVACTAFVVYWALIYTGESLASPVAPNVVGTVPPVIGAWLPNIVLGAIAIVIASSRSSRLRGSLGAAP
jgi:lipopolysaccharide export LptBFGC system permease protein LptF